VKESGDPLSSGGGRHREENCCCLGGMTGSGRHDCHFLPVWKKEGKERKCPYMVGSLVACGMGVVTAGDVTRMCLN